MPARDVCQESPASRIPEFVSSIGQCFKWSSCSCCARPWQCLGKGAAYRLFRSASMVPVRTDTAGHCSPIYLDLGPVHDISFLDMAGFALRNPALAKPAKAASVPSRLREDQSIGWQRRSLRMRRSAAIAPALPSCAAADHLDHRSLPAGKLRHRLSRPNGRPLCRLLPNPIASAAHVREKWPDQIRNGRRGSP